MNYTTFIMLKPDALEAHLENEILDIFNKQGIIVLRKKLVMVNEKLILKHYEEVIERLKEKVPDFSLRVKNEFVNKQVMIVELSYPHHDIVEKVREIVGATDPAKADPLSIRGRFAVDSMEKSLSEKRILRNLIHASDSDQNAKKELELWFK